MAQAREKKPINIDLIQKKGYRSLTANDYSFEAISAVQQGDFKC
jgi:hypothetical protein